MPGAHEKIRIAKLRFRAGRAPEAEPLEIDVPTVTILVGPNNSGKSLALREIEHLCFGQQGNSQVVDGIDIDIPTDFRSAEKLLSQFKTRPRRGQLDSPDSMWIGLPTFRRDTPVLHVQVRHEQMRAFLEAGDSPNLRNVLVRPFTVRLDGRTRFSLSDPKPTGDLQAHAENHLWALFQNDDAREKVREFTEEAFGLHFTIDLTGLQHFRVRLSDRKPLSKNEEQGVDERARTFHKNATLITDLSDGVQAFTGLVSAVLSLPHRIILVDEPEAFLHPVLSRRLGQNLAEVATERDASLMVATHSADFLIGCVETTPNVRILRLTYDKSMATCRSVEPQDFQRLMNDPLLRSTHALRGLFHRCVVVAEGDTDRAFYDEINRRLQDEQRGVADALFLNAQNWQTIPRVVSPLRDLGIPAAAVMDLDVIANEGKWNQTYAMLNLEEKDKQALEELRQACKADLDALPEAADGRKRYKVEGVHALSGERKARCEFLLERLRGYGLFLVPVGEVERWLQMLRVSPDPKGTWLLRTFARIGADPTGPDYVKPGSNDVWVFVDEIGEWAANPQRRGIP